MIALSISRRRVAMACRAGAIAGVRARPALRCWQPRETVIAKGQVKGNKKAEKLKADKSKDGIGMIDAASRKLVKVLPGGSDPEVDIVELAPETLVDGAEELVRELTGSAPPRYSV